MLDVEYLARLLDHKKMAVVEHLSHALVRGCVVFPVSCIAHEVSLRSVILFICMVELFDCNCVYEGWSEQSKCCYLKEALSIPLEGILHILSVRSPVFDKLIGFDWQVSDESLLLIQGRRLQLADYPLCFTGMSVQPRHRLTRG